MSRLYTLGIAACFSFFLSACGEHASFYGHTSNATVAASCKLAFANNPINLNAFAGEPFSVTLASLLVCNPGGPLSWSIDSSAPAWLMLDNTGGLLIGTPGVSDVGNSAFNLSVTSGESGAIALVNLTVSARPHWSENPVLLGTTPQDQPFVFDLRPFVSDPLNRPLTITAQNLPSWMSLNDGVLSGTPHLGDVGNYFGITLTATAPDGSSASAEAQGSVTRAQANPPVWSSNPINLGSLPANQPFSFDLKPLVSDPLGRPLTITAAGLPSWMTIQNGVLQGTPPDAAAGPFTGIVLTATAPNGDSAQAMAFGTVVVPTPAPPQWASNPIDLGTQVVGTPFSFDLKPLVTDSQGQPITITAQNLPDWMSLADGVLSGTPTVADIGAYSGIELTATTPDGGTATAQAFGQVTQSPGPIIHAENLIFQLAALDQMSVTLTDPSLVESPSGRPLSFSLIDTAPWVKLYAIGKLELRPPGSLTGVFKFRFTVSDGITSATGTITVIVVKKDVILAPVWLRDPILLFAIQDKAWHSAISQNAMDPQGLTLVYHKKSGPAWLTVHPDGSISGTPTSADLGENDFTVTVSNGFVSADATLTVEVVTPDDAE